MSLPSQPTVTPARLSELVGAKLQRVLYWYPGGMAPERDYDAVLSDRTVHNVDLGVQLYGDSEVTSLCWRMDDSDEWLDFTAPYASNPALEEYWMVDATASWAGRGLIGRYIERVFLSEYQEPSSPEPERNIVGLTLRMSEQEVSLALGEYEGGRILNAADNIVVTFSASAFRAFAKESRWTTQTVQ